MVVPALAFATAAGAAKGGNSANAKACQKGGWENWVRADQTPFANQDECVSYGAQGGTLTVPLPQCFDSTNPVMAFDFQLTAPVDTSANTTVFWSSDGSCSGGVLLKDTTVVASDHAQAVSKCATIAGAGDNAFLWQASQYTTAPGNWWGCGVYV